MKTKEKSSLNYLKALVATTFVLVFASSCIPNERVIYLQNQDDEAAYGLDTLITLSRQDYRLQPNDILLISFFSRQEEAVEKFYPLLLRTNALGNNGGGGAAGGGAGGGQGGLYFTGFNIDKEGNIEINALGRVAAAGMTTLELKYELERIIKEKEGVNDILVNVKLDGIRYTIFGEVANSGPRTLQQYEANVIEAIAGSGDLTLNANRSRIQIIRQYPDGVRIHEIDVTSRKLLNSPFYFIQPNDIIYVPPLKIRELGTGETGLETFASVISIVSGVFLVINLVNN